MSFGQVFTRWDLLQQIAMADRFILGGKLYPSTDLNGFLDGGVSGYFPGLSLIAIILGKILINDSILYFFSFFALIATLIFIFALTNITQHFCLLNNKKNIFIFYIGIVCLFLEDYLFYASEFKPDTIAFGIGFTSIIYSGLLDIKPTNYLKLICAGIICGAAIIFKQQYVAVIFGLIVYLFLNFSKPVIFFSLSAVFSACLTIYLLSYFDNIWFWTIDIYKNDGFMSLEKFLRINQNLIKVFTLFSFILLYLNYKYEVLKTSNYKKIFIRVFNFFKISPFPIILTCVSLSSLVSGFKMGGNSGNVGLAILVIIPIFINILTKIDPNIIKATAFISIIFIFPSAINTFNKYYLYMELSNEISKSYITSNEKNPSVLSGSEVYGAVRKNFYNKKVADYWTLWQASDQMSLIKMLKRQDYNFLVIENFKSHELKDFYFRENYKIIFKNEFGLIARLTKS